MAETTYEFGFIRAENWTSTDGVTYQVTPIEREGEYRTCSTSLRKVEPQARNLMNA